MITITSLNGSEFVLNSNLIETLRSIPETKITLVDGKYYLVKEEIEEVIQKVIDYNRMIYTNPIRIEK